MLVGTAEIDIYLPAIRSLKEKRFVLKSLKTKIQNRFNVSIAEVDYQDKWQRTCLGIACVSNERRLIDSTLNKVLNLISQDDRIEIINHVFELY